MSASKSQTKLFAIADIGSASAGAGIIAIERGKPATFVALKRTVLPLEERPQNVLEQAIIQSFEDALSEVLRMHAQSTYARMPISRTYALVRAPWTQSQTSFATRKLPKAVRITQALIQEVAQEALARNSTATDNSTLESRVMRVELNGYPTAKPLGKIAEDLRVSTHASTCNPTIKEGIGTSFQKAFSIEPLFRSSATSIATLSSSLPTTPANYVVVDIESEATSILCVRDGLAAESASVPEGVRTIVARISEHGLPDDALSTLRMIARDECSGSACEAILAACARAEPDLARSFGEAMLALSAVRKMPDTLLLAGHPDLLPWLSRFFTRLDFNQFTLLSQPFEVRSLDANALARFVDVEHMSRPDTGLALVAGLVHSEQNDA